MIFPITDERQSIVGVWNDTDLVMEEYMQYDPDGRVRIRNLDETVLCDEREFTGDDCFSDLLPRFAYTGAYRSQVTGLHRFGARWYSTQVGQFTAPDPLWFVDSPDLYGYVGFDPVNYWDTSGISLHHR